MSGRLTTTILALVMAIAIIGYFVGINDGVPQPEGMNAVALVGQFDKAKVAGNPKLIPAVTYAEISETAMGPTDGWQSVAKMLPVQASDLFAEVKPSEAEKAESSKVRASRRMFNGAPPVIPHAIENTSDAACYACHSSGVKMAGMKATVMSHQFLGNCTQCHAPLPPAPFRDMDTSVETSFVGLPAPTAGKRASKGAPPTIPHSRWMRENCQACHGPTGWPGMESTHPWRTNCTQCHAPSAVLDQAIPADKIPMLPPLDVAAK